MAVYGLVSEGFLSKKHNDNKYGKANFSKDELTRIKKAKNIVIGNLKKIERDYNGCYGKSNENDNPYRKKISNACIAEYNKRKKENKLDDDMIEAYGKDKDSPIELSLHTYDGNDDTLGIEMFDDLDVSDFLHSIIKAMISDACDSKEIDRLGVSTKVIADRDEEDEDYDNYEFTVLFRIKKGSN